VTDPSGNEFGLASNDIMSMPNFMKILQAILESLYAYRQILLEITSLRSMMSSAHYVIMHAQTIVGNGVVIIIPPHDFEYLSCWFCQL
jgi:hypothetical protein